MKKWILSGVAIAAVWYLPGLFLFSDSHLQRWVANHSARAMGGEASACEDFAATAEVTLKAPGPKGLWEVQGGKDEACDHLKKTAAMMTLLSGRSHSDYSDFVVERHGFPWMTATVRFTEHTRVSLAGLPEFRTASDEVMELRRGVFGGLTITRLQAEGRLE